MRKIFYLTNKSCYLRSCMSCPHYLRANDALIVSYTKDKIERAFKWCAHSTFKASGLVCISYFYVCCVVYSYDIFVILLSIYIFFFVDGEL